MKIADIQAVLLQDKEALFKIRNESFKYYFVIDRLETVVEDCGKHWETKTRKATFAVGRLVWFHGRDTLEECKVVEHPRRYRINQIEEAVLVPDGIYTLSAWTAWSLQCQDIVIDRKLTRDAEVDLFIEVLSKELGFEVSRSDGELLSANLRRALISRLTPITS